VLAVVMTGMGQDGLLGCQAIKEHGGQVIVQDELTSVVWGMPGAVVKAGLADQIVPLNELSGIITQCVLRKRVQP
jgi:two-component system chemotaxis response regulator CheB